VLDEVDLRKLKDLHSQLGCVNYDVCRQLLGLPRSSKEDENPFCEWCVLAKQRRTVYPKEAATRAVFPIYRLFTDLSGIKRPSLAGYQYFQLIVDDCSRKVWLYLLKKKSEAAEVMSAHIKMVEREKYPLKVAFVRSDGAKELISTSIKEIYKGEIQTQISAPYSQSQNGVAERYMAIIGNCSMAMMLRASMPSYDWPFASSYAVWIVNFTPTKANNDGITPNEAYDGVKRKIVLKGVFGCLCFAKVFVRRKAEPKSRRCVFLGYSTKCKAWIVREVGSFSKSLKEFYARDVDFNVDVFPYRNALIPRPIVPPLSDLDEFGEYEEVPFYLPATYTDSPSVVSSPDPISLLPNQSVDYSPVEVSGSDEDEWLDYKHGGEEDDDDVNDVLSAPEDFEQEVVGIDVPAVRRSSRPVALSETALQQMVDNDVSEFGYSGALQMSSLILLLKSKPMILLTLKIG
jgi:transposase InsO family protein